MFELVVAKDSVIKCSYGKYYSLLTVLSDCEVNLASPPLATEKMRQIIVEFSNGNHISRKL